MDCRVFHQGGANVSSETRVLFNASFQLDDTFLQYDHTVHDACVCLMPIWGSDMLCIRVYIIINIIHLLYIYMIYMQYRDIKKQDNIIL